MYLGRFGLSIGSLSTREQKGISVDKLYTKWMINLDAANSALNSTLQLVIRTSDNPSIELRLDTNDRIPQYNIVTSDVFMDTLFYENAIKSKRQFTYAQVSVTDFGYTHIVPMKFEKYVYHGMNNLFNNVGVPTYVVAKFAG